jgi:hypothetical protein
MGGGVETRCVGPDQQKPNDREDSKGDPGGRSVLGVTVLIQRCLLLGSLAAAILFA